MRTRGFFAIGVVNSKKEVNIGTLYRSAYQLGASYIFTVGKRYKKQSSDTLSSWKHMPLFHYETLEELDIPYACRIVGVEMGGISLPYFAHPESAIYLLGAEDCGLTKEATSFCHTLVSLPSIRTNSYNVAVAGSLVMYDRMYK